MFIVNLVRLLQGIKETLKSSKMSNQLENPQDPHHPHLTNNFSQFFIKFTKSILPHQQSGKGVYQS